MKEVKNSTNVIDNNSIINAFKNEFATTVNVIYINSLKTELKFREVSVTEQKSLSKLMIENEDRRDIIYDAQCVLINNLCLDDVVVKTTNTESGEEVTTTEKFDIYNLTEFDRIRILMEIYQTNYIKNDITYTCKECGMQNTYKIDFTRVVELLNNFDLTDKVYTLEDQYRIYNFTMNYPSVRQVSNFYKNYNKKYKNTSKQEKEVLENLSNIEYINLFIKQIEMINKKDKSNRQVADLSIMSFNQIEQLISYFPQTILFDDNTGVIKYITTEFIEAINNTFNYEKCASCGAINYAGVGSVSDFF